MTFLVWFALFLPCIMGLGILTDSYTYRFMTAKALVEHMSTAYELEGLIEYAQTLSKRPLKEGSFICGKGTLVITQKTEKSMSAEITMIGEHRTALVVSKEFILDKENIEVQESIF